MDTESIKTTSLWIGGILLTALGVAALAHRELILSFLSAVSNA